MKNEKSAQNPMGGNQTLGRIAHSTGLNMISQVMIRLFSFLVNAIIIRFVSLNYIGIVNVRLTLLSTSILFLSREPMRKVCLDKGKEDWKSVCQLAWLCVPIGAVISLVLCFIWIYVLPDPNIPFYTPAVFIYAIAALICLTSEPFYIFTQLSLNTNIKVFVESEALFVRSVLNCLLLALFPSLRLVAFCLSEFIYSLLYPILYLWKLRQLMNAPDSDALHAYSLHAFRPVFQPVPAGSMRLVLLFFKQSFLKQLLTEGEKYLLSFSSVSMHDQGVYEIVNNLGSLFARFLFQPLEEGAYLFFSQASTRGQNQGQQASTVCVLLLRCLCYFGSLVVTFGYSFASALLFLYGGASLTTPVAVRMFRLYCVYVLLLGVNGTSEAFFMATAPTETLTQYNRKMVFFSVVFVVVSFLLTYPRL
ncbi:hypothetical protein WA577_006361, partial [Blastocystis sp. JDR]